MFGFFHRKQPAYGNDGVSLKNSEDPKIFHRISAKGNISERIIKSRKHDCTSGILLKHIILQSFIVRFIHTPLNLYNMLFS